MSKIWLVTVGAAIVALSAVGLAAASLFIQSDTLNFQGSGGSLSPYLVGYFDDRDHSQSPGDGGCDEENDTCSDLSVNDFHDVEPVLYLVNPTPHTLSAYIVLFDNEENPIACRARTLSPNDFTDVMLGDLSGDSDEFGVVKVVTFAGDQPGTLVQAGVKGWITHYVEEETYEEEDDVTFMRESELQEVPAEVLFGEGNYELELITGYVQENCPPDNLPAPRPSPVRGD